MNRERALKAFHGEMTDRIPHWEIISCPDAAEVGRDMPGYFFCVGNHLTWDLPPEGVKAYFDAAEKYGMRSG